MRFLNILALAVAVTAQIGLSSEDINEDVGEIDNNVEGPTVVRRGVRYGPYSAPLPKNTIGLKAYTNNYMPRLTICQGPGFGAGECRKQGVSDKVCMELPKWNQLSIAPDMGIQCMFFSGSNCNGHATRGDTVSPGITDFKGYEGLTANPQSYKCKLCDDLHTLCGGPWVGAGTW